MDEFRRRSGLALAWGGALLVLLNVVFTPMLPTEAGDAVLRASTPYLLRLSLALVSALLLLFGSLGPHLAHRERSGAFGRIAFGIVFTGTALLVAIEWSNVFILRPLAQVAPGALEPLDEAIFLNIGFASSALLFALGWILLSISLLRIRAVPAWSPALIIGGLVASPALGATPLGVNGAIVGSVIFGLGLVGLGRSVAAGSARP